MHYAIKEMFKTLQGEGAQAGRAAVFCRFTGCNLWTGREIDRHKAICQFCDTDFVGTDGEGGGKFRSTEALALAIAQTWGETQQHRYVVFTGGEPLLQLDRALIDAVHAHGFEIAIETNGTILPPEGIDWICVSPKAGADLMLKRGNELKLVYPQPALHPESLSDLVFDHYFLQPMDGPNQAENVKLATHYCLNDSRWRLSLQTHKMIGIP
jgi:7-carboxy-7-deazaguanine synthase